ncbi:MAG: IPT/TIG domain-containing protein [Polyangiaceae bacterium]
MHVVVVFVLFRGLKTRVSFRASKVTTQHISPRIRSMKTGPLSSLSLLLLSNALLAAACLPQRPEGELKRVYEDDAGVDGGIVVPDASSPTPDGAVLDPHGISALDPPHGPFTGGNRVVIQGQGFGARPRVWFANLEVGASDVVPISATKVQVIVPALDPGLVDVKVQDGDDSSTSRVLEGAYTVDPFYAQPNDGPTSGGTIITLHGKATGWSAASTVKIGSSSCSTLQLVSDTELKCTTPPGVAGSRTISVSTPNNATQSVFDAFLYSDSDNGFRGGLSGDPLNGTLKVIVLDSYTGKPIVGASVIAGDDLSTGLVAQTDAAGIATLSGPSLTEKVSVTIAKKCTKPTSFVAVPVDTVTAYLDPVLTPECIPPEEGELPPTGGKPSAGSYVSGELMFGLNGEFGRGNWSIVPSNLSSTERKVAYLFTATSDPRATFKLPDAALGVTESAPGNNGYAYSTTASAGNVSVYAIAGIEDSSTTPRKFTAYAMGVTRGVGTQPGVEIANVSIPVDIPLDQAVTLKVEPPTSSASTPEHVEHHDRDLAWRRWLRDLARHAAESIAAVFRLDHEMVGLPPLVALSLARNTWHRRWWAVAERYRSRCR